LAYPDFLHMVADIAGIKPDLYNSGLEFELEEATNLRVRSELTDWVGGLLGRPAVVLDDI